MRPVLARVLESNAAVRYSVTFSRVFSDVRKSEPDSSGESVERGVKPLNVDMGHALREAANFPKPIRIGVCRPPDTQSTMHTLEFPFGIIGRGEDCQIRLESSKVSFRHAYLQAIAGRIFCIDLGSRNGTHWPDGPRPAGWITPGESMGVGPFALQLVEDNASAAAKALPPDFNPLERYAQQHGPLPQVDLEFLYENAPQPTWSVSRVITLVGRGPQCKLRFESKSVSSAHCSLVLTPKGLWVIDLLGRDGTKVNGQAVPFALLRHEDELKIGRYRIGVRYIDERFSPDNISVDSEQEFFPAGDDMQSDLFELPSDAPKPLEWLGSIFRIEGAGDTLIVLPVIDGCSFRYAQLQTEANSLRRKFELREFKHLLMDLTHLHYFGSELIGVLISLARKTTDDGGRAALCGASGKMLEVLKNMSLHKLWPYFATREEALRSFESNS